MTNYEKIQIRLMALTALVLSIAVIGSTNVAAAILFGAVMLILLVAILHTD